MRFKKGDWVKYRSGGIWKTKKVLEIRPDGNLVLGDHNNDSDNPIIDPELEDTLKKA